MNWSNFTLKDGKHIQASPCLEVVAFSYDPPAASGPGFDRFLRAFARRFGDRLKFYRTGDMKRFRPFDSRTLDAPLHWFSDDKILGTKMLGFMAHSGDSGLNVYPPALKLSLWGFAEPPRFVFRMALPVDENAAPDEFVSFVRDALADFPLESGHCGYSFVWNETDISLEQDVCAWAAPLLLRHPGLGYGDAFTLSNAADQGIVAVSWLTFLGPRITADLGGQQDLESRCPPDVSALPLGSGGVLLRAGSAPQLGDVNRQYLLPAYRAVGQLVAPHCTTDEAFEDVVIAGMTEEDAHGWLRRFFV